MKKSFFYLFCLSLFSVSLYAQAPAKYWVQFKDKQGSTFSIHRPQEFLSPKAIENRKRFNITITEEDLPVNEHYIQTVMALDSNMVLFTQSKWLNGITIYSEKENIEQEISQLPNVIFCEKTATLKEPEEINNKVYQYTPAQAITNTQPIISFDYGKSAEQLKVSNIHWLHRLGYTGKGVTMMVMDGGFLNVDTVLYFAKMREEGRLLGARNFVEHHASPFRVDQHGTMVLSCIAANLPGELIGSAPNVMVYLAKTEDGRLESKIEEDNWVAGIEWADSLGCLVLNSSLGYTTFDDTIATPRHYKDMDGKTSRASQAATIAASKGLIVCCGAGNSGADKWKYIASPSDACDILAVGAVNVNRGKANFSSFGPTADGRIKPDICAVGERTFVGTPRGRTIQVDGTSVASPLLAGMVACLREAFPEKSNYEIMDAVRKSGDLVHAPTPGLGNGIGDFLKAYNLLLQPHITAATLSIHFDSYVYNGKQFVIHLISTQAQTISITGQTRGNAKSTTKSYSLQKGENIIDVKMSKLNKDTQYNIIDLIVSGNGFEQRYVIGGERE